MQHLLALFGINRSRAQPPATIDGLEVPQLQPQLAAGVPSTGPEALNLQLDGREDQEIDSMTFTGVEKLSPEATRFGADGTPREVLRSLFRKCHRCAKDKKSQAGSAPVKKKQKHSKKDAECPFVVEIVVYKDEPRMSYVYESNGHMGHVPGDAEDMLYLDISDELENQIEEYIIVGLSTANIIKQLQRQALSAQDAREQLGNHSMRHPALVLTPAAIDNVRKRMYARTRIDPNDKLAVGKLAEALRPEHVLDYVEQVVEGGEIKQHLQLIICTQVQQAMLREFGKKLIFMDAVFGLNRYGFPMLTLVVRDEYGHGFPAAYCISSTEDSEVWKVFLTTVLAAAGLEPASVTFMIDKSSIEMAAIRAIGAKYIWCKFHVLQDWERFLKSSASGVHGKDKKGERLIILWQLSELQRLTNKAVFEERSAEFEASLVKQGLNAVLENYLKNWKGDAEHWVRFGRLDVLDLRSDTNNLAETHFRRLKYTEANGKICARLDDEILMLLEGINGFTLRRQQRLSAALRTRAVLSDENLEHWVKELSNPANAHITFIVDDTGTADDLGEGVCKSCSDASVTYDLAVADGSCTCLANKEDVCKHVEAAQLFPDRALTAVMLQAAHAAYRELAAEGKQVIMEVNKERGIFSVVPLVYSAAPQRAPDGRLYHINTLEPSCSCHVFKAHDICPHLLAVIDEDEVEGLLAMLHGAEGTKTVLPLRRQRRIGLSPEVEPTLGCVLEVTKLRDIRDQAAAMANEGEADDAEMAAMCRDVSRWTKQMHSAQKLAFKMQMQTLWQNAKKAVATHEKTKLAQQKTDTRKLSRSDDDRKHHALFPDRKVTKAAGTIASNRIAAEAAVAALRKEQHGPENPAPQFQPAKPQGGVKKTGRGLPNLNRNTKSGGKRTKKADK